MSRRQDKPKSRAGRKGGPKTRCGGRWTEAKYNSFIKSLLRSGTTRWGPINDCLKAATTKRGFKLCAGCKQEVPVTIKEEGKRTRTKNIFVDHVVPIIDPSKGFEGWDKCVANMYCEEDNLQVLCKNCHDIKSAEERAIATERRRREKLNDQE